jgi:hypothetical protein
MQPHARPQRVQPTAPRTLRAAILSLLLVSVWLLPSRAQETTPRLQLFGGYSYVRFDSKTFGFADKSGLNGFDLMAAYNLVPGFGVVAEASGNYGPHMNFRAAVFGPQFLYQKGKMTFFAHTLFGRGESSLRVARGLRDAGNAFQLGGGVDLDLRPRFAFRIIQADYVHTHFFQQTQGNIRLSTGLVFHWGALKVKRHPAPRPQSP